MQKRTRPTLLVAMLLLAVASPATQAQAPLEGEQLFLLPPSGWQIGFHDNKGNIELTELIPPGQNNHDWSDMLTVEIVAGAPSQSTRQVLDNQFTQLQQECAGLSAGPVAMDTQNGYEIGLRAVACTKSKKWGKGEVNLYKVIRGRERLYIISRSWRGEPFEAGKMPLPPETTANWLAAMQAVVVCDTRDPQRRCPQKSP